MKRGSQGVQRCFVRLGTLGGGGRKCGYMNLNTWVMCGLWYSLHKYYLNLKIIARRKNANVTRIFNFSPSTHKKTPHLCGEFLCILLVKFHQSSSSSPRKTSAENVYLMPWLFSHPTPKTTPMIKEVSFGAKVHEFRWICKIET